MKTTTVRTPEEMEPIAREVLERFGAGSVAAVIALSGELGVGKTIFTKALAQVLGVTEHITSPTFVVMKQYATTHPVFKKLIHIDAYRVEDLEEMRVIDLPRLLEEEGSVLCIEWPERIAAMIPERACRVTIASLDEHTRTVTYGD
ncbi:tRNA (adenosine(37)-N6)-threonylcarbamoyltransferase complex ATPase subunit type 1 TsaE [Candidatus Kaiserbacteria bacterium]|nr:tRNA (adenosine(37)-N6)-threonylcarbamoyltransferase complex ATPase subunit type 1 TsaE [Candidatus Kaiserbacteria bacterium]